MPKSLLRAPARLLVLAVAVGAPTLAVAPAHATPGERPSAPTTVTATVLNGDDVQLEWDSATPAPGGDLGDEIDHYDVDWTPGNGTTDATSSTLSHLAADLAPGTYTFTVTAVDVDGDASATSAQSSPVEIEAPYVLASPSDVNATSPTFNALKVSWTGSSVPMGEASVAYYDVILDAPGEADDRVYSTQGEETSVERTNVPAGTYTVRVVAYDAASRQSAASAPSTVTVVAQTAPDAPTGLAAKQTAAGEVEVEWTYPEDDHGFDISGFDIALVGAGGQVLKGTVDKFDTTGSFTGVPAGTYTLRVSTVSNGQPATAQLAGVVVKQAPAKVGAFSVKQTGPGEVTVSWKKPASGNVTGYGVGYGTGRMGNGTTVGASATSQKFTGLRPGRYSFVVRALDSEIMGDPAMTFLEVTNYDKKTSPKVAAKDAKLKKGQKLVVTGKSKPGSFMTLEFKKAGSSEFVFLDDAKASTKKGKKTGTFTLSAKVPGSGTYRVVDNTTGRSSLTKAVKVTASGR